MLRSLLAALDRFCFIPLLLARDADGRYVSPAGRAYRVVVAPQPGAENIILVALIGAPCVPNTFINHLEVRVAAQPAAVDAAIRELLSRADEAEARYAAVRERYEWDAVTVEPPEEEAPDEPPAGLLDALRAGAALATDESESGGE